MNELADEQFDLRLAVVDGLGNLVDRVRVSIIVATHLDLLLDSQWILK